jgi:hypothetical protein
MFYDLRSLSLGSRAAGLDALVERGYRTTQDLLETFYSPGQPLLTEVMRDSQDVLRTWVSRADLMRVWGIGAIYAALLQLSGVESLDQLIAAEPAEVSSNLSIVNDSIRLTMRSPSASRVRRWIEYAEQLPLYGLHR